MWDIELERVRSRLELLQERGPQLGRPLVDTVKGLQHKNMKELRPGTSGRSEARMLFAFDSERRAIVLVAGDKSGDWNGWYVKNIPIADDLFDQHLEEIEPSPGPAPKIRKRRKGDR